MPFDGSGNFSRLYNWQDDRDNGIRILAARMDGECDNFAAGLNVVFFRNGLVPMSGNINMGQNYIIGLGAGSAAALGLRFADDPNSGLYLDGYNRPSIAANGVRRLTATTSGVDVNGAFAVSGNATIGGTLGVTGALTAGSIALTSPVSIGQGGTGATTAAGARTNLGLGTAAIQNTGTSGANVPLLSAANIWGQQQTFLVGHRIENGAEVSFISTGAGGSLDLWAHGDAGGDVVRLMTGSGSGTVRGTFSSTGLNVAASVSLGTILIMENNQGFYMKNPSNADRRVLLHHSTGVLYFGGVDSDPNTIVIRSGGSDRLNVSASGVSTPAGVNFTVGGVGAFDRSSGGYATFATSGTQKGDIGVSSQVVSGGGANDFALNTRGNNLMDFGINTTRVMTLGATGLGIGVNANPAHKLQINNDTTDSSQGTYHQGLATAAGVVSMTFGVDGSNGYIQTWASKALVLNGQGNSVFICPNSGTLTYGQIEVGYRDVPRVTGGIERGKMYATSAGFTVNTGSAAGSTYSVYNDSAGAITLTQGVGLTMRLAGTASAGSRNLAARGVATIWFNSTTECVVSGPGVS